MIRARAVVSNADPQGHRPAARRRRRRRRSPPASPAGARRARSSRSTAGSPGCRAGRRCPTPTGRTGRRSRSRVPIDDAQQAFEDCTRGIPSPGFAELYFQTAYDPTVAPAGKHTMSAFVQYAPYELADGTWDERRDEIGQRDPRPDRPLLRHRRRRRAHRGARPARHRAAHRPHRRAHLPGRVHARPDVVAPASTPARPATASTCAARRPTRPAASSASTAATRRWPCSPTSPDPLGLRDRPDRADLEGRAGVRRCRGADERCRCGRRGPSSTRR